MRVAALLLVVVLPVFASDASRAETITVLGVSTFDPSLGTLESATITVGQNDALTTFVGQQKFTFDVPAFAVPYASGTVIDFYPITLSGSGSHTHTFDPGTVTATVGQVPLPTPVLTTHTEPSPRISPEPNTVDANGMFKIPTQTPNLGFQHAHIASFPEFSVTYTGDDLEPFLTGPVDSIFHLFNTGSKTDLGGGALTLSAGDYRARINDSEDVFINIPFDYQIELPGHTHEVGTTFSIASTTFNFQTTAVPEPGSLLLLTCVAGCIGGARLSKRRRCKLAQPSR